MVHDFTRLYDRQQRWIQSSGHVEGGEDEGVSSIPRNQELDEISVRVTEVNKWNVQCSRDGIHHRVAELDEVLRVSGIRIRSWGEEGFGGPGLPAVGRFSKSQLRTSGLKAGPVPMTIVLALGDVFAAN